MTDLPSASLRPAWRDQALSLDMVAAIAPIVARPGDGAVAERTRSPIEAQSSLTDGFAGAQSDRRALRGGMLSKVALPHAYKGHAMETFMAAPPCRGRAPVAAGDDRTPSPLRGRWEASASLSGRAHRRHDQDARHRQLPRLAPHDTGTACGEERLVWLCRPGFNGASVFHTLVGHGAAAAGDGAFKSEIDGQTGGEQRHDPNSAILRTPPFGAGGTVAIVDFVPGFPSRGRTLGAQRVIRQICPVDGWPRIRVRPRPRLGWGAQGADLTQGPNHVRFVGQDRTIRLTTDARVDHVLDARRVYLDRQLSFVLGPDESPSETPPRSPDASARKPGSSGAPGSGDPDGLAGRGDPGRDHAETVQPRGDRRRGRGGPVQPVLGIGLETVLTEGTADARQGYRGMGPVRIGNRSHEHFRHDTCGNVILGAAPAFFDRRFDVETGEAAFAMPEPLDERAWTLHQTPDPGIRELRAGARIHTFSVQMCRANCDRLARIAAHPRLRSRAPFWHERARVIRARITANG